MRTHHLQHVSFEGLGTIESYLRKGGHQLSSTHLYLGQKLPLLNDFDWLIIMGGPMSIHDEQKYPWLIGEKHFIRKAIDAGKKILGICLGSQLIANALGGSVERNKQREIGWFQVNLTNEAKETTLGKILPNDPVLFHWHSDTFKIPDGAIKLYSSEACTNQGFTIDKNIVALQFHPEATIGFAKELIKNCGDELDGSKYVQTEKEILGDKSKFNAGNNLIEQILLEMENQNDL